MCPKRQPTVPPEHPKPPWMKSLSIWGSGAFPPFAWKNAAKRCKASFSLSVLFNLRCAKCYGWFTNMKGDNLIATCKRKCRQRFPTWVFPKIMVPPKSSILIGFSIIDHPFWGTPIFGNTQNILYTQHASTPASTPSALLFFETAWTELYRHRRPARTAGRWRVRKTLAYGRRTSHLVKSGSWVCEDSVCMLSISMFTCYVYIYKANTDAHYIHEMANKILGLCILSLPISFVIFSSQQFRTTCLYQLPLFYTL